MSLSLSLSSFTSLHSLSHLFHIYSFSLLLFLSSLSHLPFSFHNSLTSLFFSSHLSVSLSLHLSLSFPLFLLPTRSSPSLVQSALCTHSSDLHLVPECEDLGPFGWLANFSHHAERICLGILRKPRAIWNEVG